MTRPSILKRRFHGPDRAQRVVDLIAAILIPLVAAVFSLTALLLAGRLAATIVGVMLFALLGLAFVPFRIIVGHLENYLRGMIERPIRYDVFVSYRFREHADMVASLTNALEAEGLKVWSDTRKIGAVDRNRTLGPIAWIKDSLAGQLSRGLLESCSVLFLRADDSVSSALTLSWLRDLRFDRNSLYQLVVHLHPLTWYIAIHNLVVDAVRRGWYRIFYGVSLRRSRKEAWHAWEARVGAEMGRQVTVVAIAPADEPHVSDDRVRYIRRDNLPVDVRERIIPRIVKAPKPQHQLPFLPGLQRIFADTVVVIAVCALILMAAMFVVYALETIRAAVTTPLGILLIALLVAAALVFLL